MKKILIGLISLISFFGVQGCGTTAKFVYPANGRNLTQLADHPALNQKVAVTPFEDLRDDKNRSGTMALYLIPLMPFGYSNYSRPDAAEKFITVKEFQFNPSEDLAKAAALSLRKSGLFQDSFFTFGGEKDKANYVLDGYIHSTKYKGTMISYGVSIFAPYLWIIGLPAGNSYNEIELSLKLTNLKNGTIEWEGKYDLNKSVVQGLYYNWGDDVRGYSGLMQDIMNQAIRDINKSFVLKLTNPNNPNK